MHESVEKASSESFAEESVGQSPPAAEPEPVDAKQARAEKATQIRQLTCIREGLIDNIGEYVASEQYGAETKDFDILRNLRQDVALIDAELARLRAKTPVGWERDGHGLKRTYTADDGERLSACIMENDADGYDSQMYDGPQYLEVPGITVEALAELSTDQENIAVQYCNAIGREFRRQHAVKK